MTWVVLSLAAVAVLVIYRAWLSERVGRLQGRVQATRATLELHLDRRAHAALIVGVVPVSAAADTALVSLDHDRELAESALTRALRTAWDEPWTEGTRAAVIAATDQVHLSRQFHAAALTALVRLRRHPLVRLLRAAGEEPAGYFEIDDALPLSYGATQDST